LFVLAIAIASIFASLAGIAWLSWITDLIPENIRGRFLSNRNAIGLSAAMAFALFGGQFIDRWKGIRPNDITWQSYGFSILFAFGLLCGFTALLFLRRIPDTSQTKPTESKNFFSALTLPLADVNFRRFILFSAYWGFAVSFVSPFFNVYLIKQLNVAFSVIALLDLVNGVFNILSVRIWGKLTDKFGNKPLLFICTIGASFFPFFWLFATSENYYIIWFAYIVSGLSWSGIGVNSAGLMMRLAPVEHNAVYFAIFAAITGVFTALAPIVGGVFGKIVENISLTPLRGLPLNAVTDSNAVLGFRIHGLQLLFGVSFILRLSAVLFLKRVESPTEATVAEVVTHLKKATQPVLIMQAHRAARYGMYPIENMSLAMSRGASILEGNIERFIDLSIEGVEKGWHLIVKVNRKFDSALLRLEYALNLFADWIISKFG
jgi:MFS family permease